MQPLITNRLILRGFTSGDAGALLEIAGNPNVASGAGFEPLDGLAAAKALIDSYNKKGGIWALQHRLHNKVIGMLGLEGDAFRPEAVKCKMMTVLLAEKLWGAGYAKEAARTGIRHCFLHTDTELVTAYHSSENIRFKHMLEKCGFTCEGTLRRAVVLWNGENCDVVCYSLLREEFKIPPATRKRNGAPPQTPL